MKKTMTIVLGVAVMAGAIVALEVLYLKPKRRVETFMQEQEVARAGYNGTEIIFTRDEVSAVMDPKNISDPILIEAADLWQAGTAFLLGEVIAVDTETANLIFAQSASLGFAPSLEHLRQMYKDDFKNPYLALVYLNLTIASGHSELVDFYQKMRTFVINNAGRHVADEIEKIAIHKRMLILKNIEKAKKNPEKPIKSKNIIDAEDVLFDLQFWEGIVSGHLVTGDLEKWLEANYGRKLDRLGKKYKKALERISSYKD